MDFTNNSAEVIKQLGKEGAFLTSKYNGKVNTMTIGWGSIGFVWRKPVFTVLVRQSRYTKEFIENSGNFTVSVPFSNDMKKVLAICGTKSGRDIDKFKMCNLQLNSGRSVDSPVIAGCDMYYECKVIYKQDMKKELLTKEVDSNCYPDGDYHTVYYGEIVNCYEK
ncbi:MULTISPECIES: flavin reductase family protein [Clostridium]|uniref:Flavoredoxin n=1 Tax=Clostridium ragsdalei P11 TaxID=1353534 RepID=A0A1A6AXM5_9CLOT|nr:MULTISPECIES: flavin reductase family protein [Clostridium]OBR94834.1 flavoredoxin [Clostridium ragsdalei P11]QXE20407.1 flavin reductase [Clostridium sp. 001]